MSSSSLTRCARKSATCRIARRSTTT
jgi:hypothetical protein